MRTIDAQVFVRTATASLARLACRYADPAGLNYEHDHSTCLLDDESLTADLLLRLAVAVAVGDETAMLDRLSELGEWVSQS